MYEIELIYFRSMLTIPLKAPKLNVFVDVVIMMEKDFSTKNPVQSLAPPIKGSKVADVVKDLCLRSC